MRTIAITILSLALSVSALYYKPRPSQTPGECSYTCPDFDVTNTYPTDIIHVDGIVTCHFPAGICSYIEASGLLDSTEKENCYGIEAKLVCSQSSSRYRFEDNFTAVRRKRALASIEKVKPSERKVVHVGDAAIDRITGNNAANATNTQKTDDHYPSD